MNNKITFPRLATLLADKSGRSKRFSEDFLREFFLLISESLEKGESIKVKGLGTFRLTRVEPRKSVDVTTGLAMEIPGHSKVAFTPSKELAEIINSPFEAFSAVEIADDIDIDSFFPENDLQVEDPNQDNAGYTENDDIISMQPDSEIQLSETPNPSHSSSKDDRTEHESDFIPTLEKEETIKATEEYLEERSHESAEDFITQDISSKNENLKPIVTNDREESSPIPTGYSREEATADHEESGQDYREESLTEQSSGISQSYTSSDAPKDNDSLADAYTSDDAENDDDSLATTEASQCGVNQQSHHKGTEATEEYHESRSRNARNNFKRIFLIIGSAAVLGLIVTFGIWYLFASHSFKKSMQNYSGIDHEYPSAGSIFKSQQDVAEIQRPSDPATDEIENTEIIEESDPETVPTPPSDEIVYDTISTTRYLTTMAKEHYGNFNLWPYIYEENKSILGHPDRIRPGTAVVIPKLSKYGVDPYNNSDIEKAKQLGIEIYARYGKKI